MLIETQETPDRNVLNFFPPVRILKSGTAEFVDAKSLRKSPLAEQIFDLGGIKSLFMTAEMISVTKEDEADWEELKPQILAEIMDYAALGDEAVIETPETAADETDVVNRIIGLINALHRPASNRTEATSFSKTSQTELSMSKCAATAPAVLTP